MITYTDFFTPGDKIQHKPYKIDTDGTVHRVNGALELTLQYYGKHYCVYTWYSPQSGNSGEETMPRPEFDEKIALVPPPPEPPHDERTVEEIEQGALNAAAYNLNKWADMWEKSADNGPYAAATASIIRECADRVRKGE
jgi:hypothetical protein